jgi:hypothetical protein
MQDTDLEQNIEALKLAISSWAQRHDLWFDACFQSWFERRDDEPRENPCVLVFCPGGSLSEILHGYYGCELYDEFQEIVYNCGYYFELEGYGALFFYVHDNDELQEAYRNYFEWKWICSLVQLDFSDLYEEIYERFYKQPQDLYHLEPRQLEILLDGIFRNNGYQTQLGSGQGDGGVDLRLYCNDVIGEVVTLVQVKRYASSNPIDLEAVQALSGVVEDERANRGLFVTTSRYLPCAQKFAARQNKRLELATSNDVSCWSSYAAERIIRDKSHLVKPDYVKFLLNTKGSSDTLEGKIFHAHAGYTMTMNSFAIVLRESRGAALLMKLPSIKINGDSYQGYEVAYTESAVLDYLDVDYVFRAKKYRQDKGDVYLWGNQQRYLLWDGTPQDYDYLD